MKLGQTSLLGAVIVAVAISAVPPPADGDILIFKDGFTIEGGVREKMTFIPDPNGPITVRKQGVPFWIDDGVRKILFSPSQLKEALADKPQNADLITFKQTPPDSKFKNPLHSGWLIDGSTDWDDRWQREVTLKTPTGQLKVKQRITALTPNKARIDGMDYKGDSYYNPKEIGAKELRKLIYLKLSKTKESDLEQRVKVYRFLLQAGFTKEAEKELGEMVRDFPKEQSKIAPLQDNIKRIYAMQLVEALKRSDKAGLYGEVDEKLRLYAKDKVDDLLDEATQLEVQKIKDQRALVTDRLSELKRLLRAFPPLTPPSMRDAFQGAAAVIEQELNADTVDRLDTFRNIAGDYERALKDKRNPEHTPAEVLSFAVTGWLRGSDAAERDPEIALKQWNIRGLLLDFLKTSDPLVRKNKLLPALKAAKLSVDEAMQIIGRLPPSNPHAKLDATPQTLQTLNDGKQFSYELQLPPGYHHGRAWPLLLVLHAGAEKPAIALARWAELAAQHGYIVAVPHWSKAANSVYQFSAQEHSAVLETLRDLRRRFQIDSDRVFLFGGGVGAVMAFDVGLSHPDQFAGVVPMSGPPLLFARRYWPNAQYLELYVIDGDQTSGPTNDTQQMFVKNFIPYNFPAIYIEYKGRPSEWFGAEPPIIFDWMNRKHRAHPLAELSGPGREFRTQRSTDNQFYWLSSSTIAPGRLNSIPWDNNKGPATLQAKVFSASNEIHIKTTGVGSVTVWFPPKLVNYGAKVTLRVNDTKHAPAMITPNLDTLLEMLYLTGDRQQLYLARVEVRA